MFIFERSGFVKEIGKENVAQLNQLLYSVANKIIEFENVEDEDDKRLIESLSCGINDMIGELYAYKVEKGKKQM